MKCVKKDKGAEFMNNCATRQEKRGKPHNKRRGIFVAIAMFSIFISTIIFQYTLRYKVTQENIINTGTKALAGPGDSKPTPTPTPIALPTTIDTVDSRSDGIMLNLFDYDGRNADGTFKNLDTTSNSITSPTIAGINAISGKQRELLFLGIATPTSNSINAFTGGSTARQGIVKNTLEDGYPVLNTTTGPSLNYLFNPTVQVPGKTIYSDVNHLFKRDSEGYYVYNSNVNYAYYGNNSGGGDFTVYSDTYSISNPSVKKVGFFPFNQYDETQKDVSAGSTYYNHHFGMSMDFDFILPDSGLVNGREIVFEFSGDDDVWVFVDGVLLLDLGGIHEDVKGTINFAKKQVSIPEYFDASGTKHSATTIDISNKLNTSLTTHNLKFYYLERGSCYSNNEIKFNLPTGLHIKKNLIGENTSNFDKAEYAFKLYVKGPAENSNYALYKGNDIYRNDNKNDKVTIDSNGVFKMKAGDSVDIYDIDANSTYYLEEVNIKDSIISDVKMGSSKLDKTYTDVTNGIYSVKSEEAKVCNRPSISFDNQLREQYKDIVLKKQWKNSDNTGKSKDFPSEVKLKLYANDGGSDTYIDTYSLTVPNWEQKITHMPVRIGDKQFTYKVVEEPVAGYSPTYVVTEDNTSYTITAINRLNPFSITAVKKWYKPDGTDKTDVTVNGVNVKLVRSTQKLDTIPVDAEVVGQTVLNSSNNWTDHWDNLDSYKDGCKLYYYLVEDSLSDYETTYENNGISIDSQGKPIIVENTCKYIENITFPETGGPGTVVYTVSGIALLMLSGILFIVHIAYKRRCKF